MSTAIPGYVFQCQAPPTPSPASRTRRLWKPAWSSLIAAPIPEKPPPTTTTSWSGVRIFEISTCPKVPTRSAQQLNGRVFAELGLASLEPANLAVTSQVPDFGSAMEAAYLLEALSVAAVLISGLNFEPDLRSSVTVTPGPRSFGFTEPLVFTLP